MKNINLEGLNEYMRKESEYIKDEKRRSISRIEILKDLMKGKNKNSNQYKDLKKAYDSEVKDYYILEGKEKALYDLIHSSKVDLSLIVKE